MNRTSASKAELPVPRNRAQFCPSGKVDWLRFVPCSFVVFVAAALMAVVLGYIRVTFIHVVALSPVLASVPVAYLLRWAVWAGYCRNFKIVWGIGIAAGVLLFIGSYHVSMATSALQRGTNVATRFEMLPGWIRSQMRSQQLLSIGRTKDQEPERSTIGIFGNCAVFALECLSVVTVITVLAANKSREPFDERRRKWMKQFSITCSAGSCARIASTMGVGNLNTLASRLNPQRDKKEGYTELVFTMNAWEANGATSIDPEESIWLTGKEIRPPDKNGIQRIEIRIRLWSVLPDEYAAIQRHRQELPPLDSNIHLAVSAEVPSASNENPYRSPGSG